MAINTFGGGGGGSSSTPELMGLEDDTIYLGRVVTGAWSDIKATVAAHSSLNGGPNYTDHTNIAGQGGMYPSGNGAGLREVGNAAALELAHTLTIEGVATLWSDIPGYMVGYSGSGELEVDNALYTMKIEASGVDFGFYNENGVGINRTGEDTWKEHASTQADSWHHWAETLHSDGTIKMYVDGIESFTQAGTVASGGTSNSNLNIGCLQGTANTAWQGIIRDIRISTIVKTQPQLQAAALLALGSLNY